MELVKRIDFVFQKIDRRLFLGKSTTISMITGLIPPTSGQIIVNGFDIATSVDDVRDTLGLCPQYNILFDYLTVREHLRLFATVRINSLIRFISSFINLA
jgi:ABC-type multidrug transport system ATPase subunit